MSRRRIFWLVAGAAVIALVFLAFRPRPIEVDTAIVTRGGMSTAVEGEARTRVRNLYVITAPVSGKLLRMDWNAGDSVSRGSTLARIAPAQQDPQTQALARAKLSAAEAVRQEVSVRIQQATDASAQAQRNYTRLTALQQSGAISLQQLEDADHVARSARDDLLAAGRRLEAAEADVSAARSALIAVDAAAGGAQIVNIAAPSGGRVLRIPQRSERVVAAGTPLMEIGNPSDMEVVIDVLSTDAVRVDVGNRVELKGWGGDSTLLGQVDLIEPSATTRISALGVEEQRVNVVAHLIGQPVRMGDGFRADARIINWESDNVLVVPVSALFRSGAEWNGYVVRDGKARLVKVSVGHLSDSSAEVLSGVTEGDEVVLFPSDKISDGVSVKRR